jgi:SnoaL-like domain
MPKLSARDRADIYELNAQYGLAVDDLLPDSAKAWAKTFASDGRFTLLDADGNVELDVQGTDALRKVHDQFPNRSTTRHFYGGLLIEPARGGARMRCHFISVDIVAKTVVRSGVCEDNLGKIRRLWRFTRRVIRMDR